MVESKLVEEQKKTFLDEARAERERIEKAVAENKELIAKMEQLKEEQVMWGKTDAGKPQEKPKEETPKEYADRISKGRF